VAGSLRAAAAAPPSLALLVLVQVLGTYDCCDARDARDALTPCFTAGGLQGRCWRQATIIWPLSPQVPAAYQRYTRRTTARTGFEKQALVFSIFPARAELLAVRSLSASQIFCTGWAPGWVLGSWAGRSRYTVQYVRCGGVVEQSDRLQKRARRRPAAERGWHHHHHGWVDGRTGEKDDDALLFMQHCMWACGRLVGVVRATGGSLLDALDGQG
jgi:hypothetical protein